MKLYLIGKGLWDIVSGDETLAADANEDTKKSFNKRANLALAAVGLNVRKGVQIYTRSEKTAKDAWDKLAARFEKKSLSAIINYRRRLYGMRAERNTDMHSHVNRIKTVAEHLEAIGDNVSEKDLAIVLLSSLPEDYAQLVTALETATEPDDLTWDMVRDRVLNEFEKKRTLKLTNGSDDALLMGETYGNTAMVVVLVEELVADQVVEVHEVSVVVTIEVTTTVKIVVTIVVVVIGVVEEAAIHNDETYAITVRDLDILNGIVLNH